MSNALKAFIWPRPLGESGESKWTGSTFCHASGRENGVIVCTDSDSNWSNELTLLHEAEAGQGDHPIDRASRNLAIRSFRKYIKRTDMSVLMDVGCSSGFLLKDLKTNFPNSGLIGSDYLAGLLDRLSQKMPGIPLIQFDLREAPLKNECLDAVTCINVLEHIDDDKKAISEIYRMLKKGGVAHIEVPASPECYDIYDEHLMHYRRYTMRDLEKKCLDVGFGILEKTHLGAFVFPAFYIIKRRNKKYLILPTERKKELVKKMISKTRSSVMMKSLSRMELLLGKYISYPFGIRCVITIKKD